jgi:hypothetical protein
MPSFTERFAETLDTPLEVTLNYLNARSLSAEKDGLIFRSQVYIAGGLAVAFCVQFGLNTMLQIETSAQDRWHTIIDKVIPDSSFGDRPL